MSISWLWYSMVVFVRRYHWGTIDIGQTRFLCVISYNYMWIYNYLKTKSLKKNFRYNSSCLLVTLSKSSGLHFCPQNSRKRKLTLSNQFKNWSACTVQYIKLKFLDSNSWFSFFSVMGLELRAYTSSHSTSPFFVMGFFETGSANYLPKLTSNSNPPDPCLSGS
jgi:hypothetical protein